MLQPKPLTKPRPTIYAGGESEAAKDLIASKCDAYLMHGDPPERVAAKIQDMQARRERLGLAPMVFGVAAYVVTRGTQQEAAQEVRRITDVKQSALGYENYQQWLAGTQRDWSARTNRFRIGSVNFRPLGSIYCYSNAVLRLRKWSVSPNASFGTLDNLQPQVRIQNLCLQHPS
jgi:FMNH2-dependent dimethyl sulfone monooxygenase